MNYNTLFRYPYVIIFINSFFRPSRWRWPWMESRISWYQWRRERGQLFRYTFRLFFLVYLKFIYSEKATKFCEFFTLLLTVCTVLKSKVKISQNLVTFSKYMKFTSLWIQILVTSFLVFSSFCLRDFLYFRFPFCLSCLAQ